jgi:ABC-2 type transport system permease protein
MAGTIENTVSASLPGRLATWWTILRICIEERLVYRGDFALGTLMRFLPLVTQIFLWTAVFAAVDRGTVAGYSLDEFIVYYLLTNVGRAFSSMPGLATGIARQIRSGEVKKFLIQPVDMIGFMLLTRVAHKLVYYMIALGPFALVFYLCREYFHQLPDPTTWLAVMASLVMGFLIGFFLESLMGMLGFWLLEVSSLLFVFILFTFFFSGHMFPLDMIGEPWGTIIRALPLQYLAYFPAAVFLGKIEGPDLAWGLLAEAAWLVALIVANRVAFRFGVRRYAGYGG